MIAIKLLKVLINIVYYYYLFKIFYYVVKFILSIFLKRQYNLLQRYSNKTNKIPYVVITGGSDGIGKGFAIEFAKLGFNIYLIARTKSKLKSLCDELSKKYNITAEYLQFDFNNNATSYNYYEDIFSSIFKNKDVSILVNNIGTVIPKLFIDTSIEDCDKAIKMNICSQVYLTKLFLESNKDDFLKKAIINLSSMSSDFFIPYHCVYASCKRFNEYFSTNSSYEFNNKNTKNNIDVLCVKPGGVATPLSQLEADYFIATTPFKCSSSALKKLGFVISTYGYWLHSIQAFFASIVPEYLVSYFGGYVIGKISQNRTKYD